MEAEMRKKIESTVREFLEEADLDQMTEYKIRKQASVKLGINLSDAKYKAFVRHVVNKFLEEQKAKEEVPANDKRSSMEYDDEGNLIICRLSEKRKVTVQEFKGKNLLSIREYYNKDGKDLPTSKGISLTEEQWLTFKQNISNIEEAVQRMESRIM